MGSRLTRTHVTESPSSLKISSHRGTSKQSLGSFRPKSSSSRKVFHSQFFASSLNCLAISDTIQLLGKDRTSCHARENLAKNHSCMATSFRLSQNPLSFTPAMGASKSGPKETPRSLRMEAIKDVPLRCIPRTTNTFLPLMKAPSKPSPVPGYASPYHSCRVASSQ